MPAAAAAACIRFQSLHPSPVQPPGIIPASWPCELSGRRLRGRRGYGFANFGWLSMAIRKGPFLRTGAAANSGTTSQDTLSVKGEFDVSVKACSDDSSDGLPEQSHLDLLEKLTSQINRGSKSTDKTIAEQLTSNAAVEGNEPVVPLGKKENLKYNDLTISQKRNIRRQRYLDEVAKRNDAPFFLTTTLFVILPPIIILGLALATGYIQLLP